MPDGTLLISVGAGIHCDRHVLITSCHKSEGQSRQLPSDEVSSGNKARSDNQ